MVMGIPDRAPAGYYHKRMLRNWLVSEDIVEHISTGDARILVSECMARIARGEHPSMSYDDARAVLKREL